MAASANPPGNNNQEGSSATQKVTSSSPAANGAVDNGGNKAADNSETISALRHNPGISVDWTHEEQSLLEDLLAKLMDLQKKENGKRRKEDHSSRKSKDKKVCGILIHVCGFYTSEAGLVLVNHHWLLPLKDVRGAPVSWMSFFLLFATVAGLVYYYDREKKRHIQETIGSSYGCIEKSISANESLLHISVWQEKTTDSSAKSSSHLNVHPNGPSYAPPMMPIDTDEDISYKAIGGVSGDLLEQNAQMFNQVSTNFPAFQIHENVNILCKARDNILSILNDLNDLPEVMKQMPPLPVKVNEELANSILPRPPHQKKS